MDKYFDIAFTDGVRELQRHKGSEQHYEQAAKSWPTPVDLEANEVEHIRAANSFYMATTSDTGWPYVQHRGGDAGFVKILGPTTIGWLERNGNRQYVGTGNLTTDDRVAIIIVDYPQRTRLKLYGHATYHPQPDDTLLQLLDGATIRNDGAITVEVAALDWNCPKYITPRFTADHVASITSRLQQRIDELEQQLTTDAPT